MAGDGNAFDRRAAFDGDVDPFAASPELAPGTMVAGYRVEEAVGHGGFAVVYRAVHEALGRMVALKVLSRPQGEMDPAMLQSFMREAKAYAKIKHPNIVAIYDAGIDDGRVWLSLEYVEGRTVQELVRSGEPIDEAFFHELFRSLVSALQEIHSHDLLHRDVKTSNVVRVADTFKLLDFGTVKELAAGVESVTATDVGTWRMLAPEVIRGGKVSVRSDVFQLGMTMLEVCCGVPVFAALDDYYDRVLEMLFGKDASLRVDINDRYREVILGCLHPDPAKRYSSAAMVQLRLRSALRCPPGWRSPLRKRLEQESSGLSVTGRFHASDFEDGGGGAGAGEFLRSVRWLAVFMSVFAAIAGACWWVIGSGSGGHGDRARSSSRQVPASPSAPASGRPDGGRGAPGVVSAPPSTPSVEIGVRRLGMGSLLLAVEAEGGSPKGVLRVTYWKRDGTLAVEKCPVEGRGRPAAFSISSLDPERPHVEARFVSCGRVLASRRISVAPRCLYMPEREGTRVSRILIDGDGRYVMELDGAGLLYSEGYESEPVLVRLVRMRRAALYPGGFVCAGDDWLALWTACRGGGGPEVRPRWMKKLDADRCGDVAALLAAKEQVVVVRNRRNHALLQVFDAADGRPVREASFKGEARWVIPCGDSFLCWMKERNAAVLGSWRASEAGAGWRWRLKMRTVPVQEPFLYDAPGGGFLVVRGTKYLALFPSETIGGDKPGGVVFKYELPSSLASDVGVNERGCSLMALRDFSIEDGVIYGTLVYLRLPWKDVPARGTAGPSKEGRKGTLTVDERRFPVVEELSRVGRAELVRGAPPPIDRRNCVYVASGAVVMCIDKLHGGLRWVRKVDDAVLAMVWRGEGLYVFTRGAGVWYMPDPGG